MAAGKTELYEKAQKHIRKGQWEDAIELMESVYLADRSDPIVTIRLGDLYKKIGRDKAAAGYYFKTANIYAENGQTTKAAATYKMVLRIDPTLAEVQEKLDGLSARRDALDVSPAPATASIVTSSYSDESRAMNQGTEQYDADQPDGQPMEVYYGATGKADPDDGDSGEDAPYEQVPGLVELGATVGRIVPVDRGDGRGGEDPDDIELSVGRTDVEIESFTKAAEKVSRPDRGSHAGPDMFTDFAADVQAPPEARPVAESAPRTGKEKPAPAAERPKVAGKEAEFLLGLEEDELWELLGRMDRLTFGPGEMIIREGESGDSIYIITGGRVSITTTKGGTVIKLAELGENDFFGEVSFLTGKPRTADVAAMETTTVMEFSRAQMDGLITKYPNVEKVLTMFYKDRVADTISTMKYVSEGML